MRLSVPEIELLVELSIAFDFVVAIVLFLLFFCRLIRLQKYAVVFNSHCKSLGKHKNSWVKSKYSLGTGEAKFSLGRGE